MIMWICCTVKSAARLLSNIPILLSPLIMHMMANAFKTSVAGLEKELEALITDNQIQARIDSHNILYARYADQRNVTIQQVLQTGSDFDRDVRSINAAESESYQLRLHTGTPVTVPYL